MPKNFRIGNSAGPAFFSASCSQFIRSVGYWSLTITPTMLPIAMTSSSQIAKRMFESRPHSRAGVQGDRRTARGVASDPGLGQDVTCRSEVKGGPTARGGPRHAA